MRIQFLVAVLMASSLVAACGAGGVGYSPPAAFPFSPGTTWTLRHTQTPPGGSPSTGTLTVVYGGTATYRGSTYHYIDGVSTLTPGISERDYFAWTGVARLAATVLTDATGILEIIFDKTFVLYGAAESQSGTHQVYFNGAFQGTGNWSASSTNAGTFVVTVPAGTFTTTRWNWLLTVGALGTNASTYAAGSAVVEVRRDAATTSSGSPSGTYSYELTSGAVPAATTAASLEIPIRLTSGLSVKDIKDSFRVTR